jgi:predicted ABC-type ATPase
MSVAPRLRMIAGPNASGKTTLTKFLFTLQFNFGDYINADELEAELNHTGKLDLSRYKIHIDHQQYRSFFVNHPLSSVPFENTTEIKENCLYTNGSAIDGYYAAILADFIRRQLLHYGRSFTFETVMSGIDKITFLKSAKEKGYRNYLYYICTDDDKIKPKNNQ